MAIFELYSQRAKLANQSGQSDVYQYDIIPSTVRVQLVQIAIDGIGMFATAGFGNGMENPRWEEIDRLFSREKGVHKIIDGYSSGDRVTKYLHQCPTLDLIDLLELICITIIVVGDPQRINFRDDWNVKETGQEAVDEMNYRLRQGGVGFQYENGQIIRVDSQFIHAEVVKPALSMMAGKGFEGPREEFMVAHAHYRAGEYKQAIAQAANSFESMIKAVCDKKKWPYQKGARASDLLKVLKAHHLWPEYLDNSFDQLLAVLKSGLPEIRNNDASHGQGSALKTVPGYIAAFALHLAASKIVLIGEAANA